MAAIDGVLVGLQWVPGYYGSKAIAFLALAAVPAGFAALRVRAPPGRSRLEGVVAVGLVFVVAMLGLSRLPGSLRARNAEYKAYAGVPYRQAEAKEQVAAGADPGFIAFLAKRLPVGVRFYVLAGPTITTSGPHSWAQYVLMPRVEEYFHPCAAQWIVFVAAKGTPLPVGVKLGRPIVTYKPGYAVARNLGRCTP